MSIGQPLTVRLTAAFPGAVAANADLQNLAALAQAERLAVRIDPDVLHHASLTTLPSRRTPSLV